MRGWAYLAGTALLCVTAGAAMAAEPVPVRSGTAAAPPTGLVARGDDRLVGNDSVAQESFPGGSVSLNLVDVPLAVAAKAVLADTFGWGYTLDAELRGTLTLQTGGPVSRATLLALFESALSGRNLLLKRRGRTAQIVPAGGGTLQPVRGVGAEAGAVVVPLRWIAAAEMQAILAAAAPREVVLRADRARNLLILKGDAGQIQTLRQTIAVFDVDWMRGMSTALLPVRSANPRSIARDLTQIFGGEAAGAGDIIRFVPNEALGAVLVVSSRAAYLDRARVWLAELETLAADRDRQLFVYRIQNRSAKELAAVLQGIVVAEAGSRLGLAAAGFGAGSGTGFETSGPGAGTGGLVSGGSGFGGGGFGGGGVGGSGLGGEPSRLGPGPGGTGQPGSGPGSGSGSSGPGGFGAAGFGANEAGPAGAGGIGAAYGPGPAGGESGPFAGESGAGAGRRREGIGIVADETNNSLVVSATRNQYDKILHILGQLDAMPTQVLLETVIAEVTLNDQLQFGVQWFLQNQGDRLLLASRSTAGRGAASAATAAGTAASGTAALIGAATRGIPGFSYLLSSANFNVVLNALQGVTKVHVLSSPNVTVLDNRTARLQIGDQVPIVKQSGQSVVSAGAPILNQIELKDTGVILAVTPRVNKNGLVVLDINQEVSDVVPTTSSTIDSPTIRQRRVATSVAVNDGHTLALGGLVQEKAQRSDESLPILGDLPLIGPAFRTRDDVRTRTELIVFIRPKVIRGAVEADRIADDFRQQLKAMMPVRPVPPPPPMAPPVAGTEGLLRRMID